MVAPFVSFDWLDAHRDEVVLADVRWYLDGRSGREAFEQGHLPGAVFIDLDRFLSAPASPAAGRNPLPDPAVFAQGMSEAGIGDAATVVAYDDAGGVIAARLVWMLRATGHSAALLDGGLRAYDGPLESDAADAEPVPFATRPWPSGRLAAIDELHQPGRVLVDARDFNRYDGSFEPIDPRAGHIPGARSVPARKMLDDRGRLLEAGRLRQQLAAGGVSAGDEVVASCGSGVTACHVLLVLEHLGLPAGRLYPGSFSQWSHSDRRVVTGGAP